MSSTSNVQEQDSRLARAINQEARSDPSSPDAGKFVAIAGGKIIAVGKHLDDDVASFKQAVPERSRGLVINRFSYGNFGRSELFGSERNDAS